MSVKSFLKPSSPACPLSSGGTVDEEEVILSIVMNSIINYKFCSWFTEIILHF